MRDGFRVWAGSADTQLPPIYIYSSLCIFSIFISIAIILLGAGDQGLIVSMRMGSVQAMGQSGQVIEIYTQLRCAKVKQMWSN